MGYYPFSVCAGSRYSKLYHDTGAQGREAGGHDTASNPATRPACAQGSVTARALSLASGVCRDTNDCIVTGGAGLAS